MRVTLDAAAVLQEYLAELRQGLADANLSIERMAKRLLLESLLEPLHLPVEDVPAVEDLQAEMAARELMQSRVFSVEGLIRDLRNPATAEAVYQMAAGIEYLTE